MARGLYRRNKLGRERWKRAKMAGKMVFAAGTQLHKCVSLKMLRELIRAGDSGDTSPSKPATS